MPQKIKLADKGLTIRQGWTNKQVQLDRPPITQRHQCDGFGALPIGTSGTFSPFELFLHKSIGENERKC